MMTRSLHMSIVRLMLLLSPFVSTTNGNCQGETETISLTRNAAVARAISHNIDLKVRAIDSSISKNNITASRSIYNPTVNASIDYAQTNVAGQDYGTENTSGALALTQLLPTGATISLSSRTGPTSAYSDPLYDYTDWSTAVGITIYQPLLKNAGKEATELGISQDLNSYAGSLERFRENVINTVFSVITEYNRLYVLHKLLESRNTALISAQQLLEEINARPTPDVNYKVAVSNAEYAISQRQTELIEAERQVNSKEAVLRYLIGIEEKIHIIPVDPPSREEPPETELEAISMALQERPDLKDLRIQLQSSELREKVSEKNRWPALALTASGGYRGYAQDGNFSDTTDQIGDGKGRYWAAGLLFQYPLGNDLAESEYLRNKLRSDQLRKQIKSTEWKIRDTIQDDNRSLISARLQLQLTARSKLLAEQRVAQYLENRRLGTASVKDLIDAENDLIYARNLELTAIDNFAYNVARLWRDIGVLLERQNIRIDTTAPDQLTDTDTTAPGPVSAGFVVDPATHVIPPPTSPEPPVSFVAPMKQLPQDLAVPVKADGPAGYPSASPAESHTNSSTPDAGGSQITGATYYTLQTGEYFITEISVAKKKFEQVGLTPVMTESGKQRREVIRLFIGEYQNRQAAESAIAQLNSSLIKGFVLKNALGRYDAYAGSFFTRKDAEREQSRLAGRGINLTLRETSTLLPTFHLTAGSFASAEDAIKIASSLKLQGFEIEIREIHG